MKQLHVVLSCLVAIAAWDVLSRRAARDTIGDDQLLADWLRTECRGLNVRQQHRVAAQFAAGQHEVVTTRTLAALPEEVVAEILAPLPTGVRYLVASAAASLRASHAAAQAQSDCLDGATAPPGASGDASSPQGWREGAQQWRWWAWPHVYDGDARPAAASSTSDESASTPLAL
ncbi:hypothetical protein T484DRAFT_1860373 [Baffinella frigidus]|nr:hypothetical protein T484DRAFT_1860373 [Cryptophyta sp. CCMP2293]